MLNNTNKYSEDRPVVIMDHVISEHSEDDHQAEPASPIIQTIERKKPA